MTWLNGTNLMGQTVKKSITLNSEKDRDLLDAIDRVLAEGEFPSFSDFCKQILRQFLFHREDFLAATAAPASVMEQTVPVEAPAAAASPLPSLDLGSLDPGQMGQALQIFQQQLNDLSERITQSDANPERLIQLERELAELRMRVQRLEGQTGGSPNRSGSELRTTASVHRSVDYNHDPLLSRLGPLLEDF